MNFLDLQTAVMSDRFNETERTDVKNWINYVGAKVYEMEDWTFRITTTTLTTDATGTVTNLPANFGEAQAVWLSDGSRLTPLHDPNDFDDRYFGVSSYTSGTAAEYTISGPTMMVGPPSVLTGIRLRYQKDWTQLVADGDTPDLPAEVHPGVAIAAMKWGTAIKSDPSWLGLGDALSEVLETLRANFSTNISDKRGRQAPAYRAYGVG
jgi:hypothetical protein